jgi:hypothetical protein
MSSPNIDHMALAQNASVRFWIGFLIVSAVVSMTLPEHGRLIHLAMITITATLATGAFTSRGPEGIRAVLGGCAAGAVIGLLSSMF